MSGDGVPELVSFVVNQGVAVAVLAFLLLRLEKRIVTMAECITRLTDVLVQLDVVRVNGKPTSPGLSPTPLDDVRR